ncbi:hypothetical protein LZL87_012389 [Fusarium oxysporum]|nr:hypothetical protein LZL87_012389 [Fusarium oxysporum]
MLVLREKTGLEPELFEFLNGYRTGILAEVARNVPRILLWARLRQCTDPRDKVYGLLGMMSPSIVKLIQPNYDEPLRHTYRKMALAHVQVTQRLSILRCCQLEQNNNSNWPSWVPDWTVAQNSLFGFHRSHSRQPSGHTASQTQYVGADILEVVGIECASVSAVSYVSSATDMFEAFSSWTPGDLRPKSYPGGGSLFDAFWEVVTKGRVHDRYVRNIDFPTVADLRIRCQAAMAGEDSFEGFFHVFKKELNTDRTWLTSTYEGYLCVVMSEPQRDDRIFVLLGSDVPLLLRPTGERRFLIVGQCFMPGLMDSEALLGPLPQGWTIQMRHGYNGREVTQFINTMPGLDTIEDPSLPILPPDREVIQRRSGLDDPEFLRNFRNNVTGEVINYDPRVLQYTLDFRWRCYRYATIAFCFTILGYLLDLLPWDFMRHTAIVIYSAFNVIVAPNTHLRFKTACLHAIAAIVATLLHRWYELQWVVSTYSAIIFFACWLDIELLCMSVLDVPTDKIGEHRKLHQIRVLAYVCTAALLFRRREVFQLMFSNIKNCDPVSIIVLPPLLNEFISELNSRRPNIDISWKLISESFFAVQQTLKPLDNFYFEMRSRLYYFLKMKYRNWMEDREQDVSVLDFDYRWVPIKEDEIRLLYLPRRSWNPFSGGLIHTNLISVPLVEAKDYEYEALSYTWGDTSTQRCIAIWGSRFYISENLHQLLYARRSIFHDRVLWVDQICINQKNSEEIESQIEKMRDIYIDADRVIAWLDDSFDATMAARTILEISNQFQLWNIQSDKLLNSWDRNTPQWRAFMKFILHRYFIRAWICQEAGLGHNLQFYIGGIYLLPENIWYAMRALLQSEAILEICKESDIPANHALDVLKCWNTTFGLRPWDSESSHNKETKHCLGLMLSVCSRLQATDPRDKIYALLGISNSDIARQIKASQKISKTELFRSTAIKLLESDDDAEFVLPHAGIHASNNNPHLPSWAPDWEREIERTTELISIHLPPGMENIQRMITMRPEVDDLPNTLTYRYTAGGPSRPEFRIDPTLGWLRTNAILIDKITTQTTRSYDHLSMSPWSAQLWLAEAEILNARVPDRVVLPRTLIGNRVNSNLSWRPDPEGLLRAYRILKDDLAAFEVESLRYRNYGFMAGSQCATEAEGQGNDLALTKEFASRMKAICGGRKLCITACHRLGVVPAMTRKDDVVYIIPGMQTPYILRPVDIPIIGGSVGWFKLVGECYIDGAMDADGIYSAPLPSKS